MSFFRRLRRLRASVPVYRISSLRLIVVLTHLFRWHFYVWPRQLSLWGRLKTPVVGSSSTLHDLLIHCDIGSLFGPSGFHLGTGLIFQSMKPLHTWILGLWPFQTFFLIYDLQGRSKIREKNQVIKQMILFSSVYFTFFGSAAFARNRLTESEAESSSNYLSHHLDHNASFWLNHTAFWKPLIKAREVWSSYAIPRSSYLYSSVFWFRSFHPEPAYWIRSRTLISIPLWTTWFHISICLFFLFWITFAVYSKELFKNTEVGSSSHWPQQESVCLSQASAAFRPGSRLTEPVSAASYKITSLMIISIFIFLGGSFVWPLHPYQHQVLRSA